MNFIPKSHPRAESLRIRERLVTGYNDGLVAKEGLLAHGRGEAFDYILGEKTSMPAKKAIRAAAAQLLLADNPVISVNGNVAALCPKEIVILAKAIGAKIEVNLFYANKKRSQNIVKVLKKSGARQVLGTNRSTTTILSGTDSARRNVDRQGIFAADVVLVPLEDGDRTLALRKSGKTVITFDLNPLSRTAKTASITIVDNIVRCINLLIDYCKRFAKKSKRFLVKILQEYNNKENLTESILQIKSHLSRGAKFA